MTRKARIRVMRLTVVMVLCLSCGVLAQEVQRHGLVFENWINDTFFGGYRPDYTEKWDVPAEVNRDFGGVPVNPKAIKYGTAVDMGDALRQFDIDEPFILLIGYWEQKAAYKQFVRIVAPRIEPELWRSLWGPVTRADLEKLDALIKDRDLDYREVRRLALAMKNKPPFTEAVMVVNPKIDSRGQRRLQCSLRFGDVFEHLLPGEDPAPVENAGLWGVPFPGLIYSPPRSFGGGDSGEN